MLITINSTINHVEIHPCCLRQLQAMQSTNFQVIDQVKRNNPHYVIHCGIMYAGECSYCLSSVIISFIGNRLRQGVTMEEGYQ